MKTGDSYSDLGLASAADLQSICAGSFIASCEYHDSLPSTNTRAAEAAAEYLTELPRLIYARQQTWGRGRGENRWWSAPGAITCSILLDPAELAFPMERWPSLSLATAMAVGNALAELLPLQTDVRWKWPNDVFVNARKICGILLEVPPTRPARLVLGLGVNVNNSVSAIAQSAEDPQLAQSVTSVSEVLGRQISLANVLNAVLGHIEKSLADLARQPWTLPERWRSGCFLQGRQVAVEMGAVTIRGWATGVDADGALLVRTDHDGLQRCLGGVVSF